MVKDITGDRYIAFEFIELQPILLLLPVLNNIFILWMLDNTFQVHVGLKINGL